MEQILDNKINLYKKKDYSIGMFKKIDKIIAESITTTKYSKCNNI